MVSVLLASEKVDESDRLEVEPRGSGSLPGVSAYKVAAVTKAV